MLSMSIYYIPILIQLASMYGIYIGGPAVYIAILSFPALAVIDSFLPLDLSMRKNASRFWGNIPLYLASVLGVALYFVLAWRIGQGTMSTAEFIGAIVGVGWMSVVPIVPVSHELYHQRSASSVFLGRLAQVCYLDYTRDISHVIGHHIDVATDIDVDTAVRGANLYAFTYKGLVDNALVGWNAESDALQKRGKGRWSIGHRLYKAIVLQIVFQALMFWVGGTWAVVGALSAMILARVWAESFNYFQHYGLIRTPGSPIARRHVWNHLSPLSRIMGFEITNHADHHMDSFKSYYELKPDANAVPMPSVFVCFAAALVPPLWEGLIAEPALKQWDLNVATAEERKLAREQNLAAGWPDWFAEDRGVALGLAH
jgi:p-cymene monooxygenase